MPRFITTVFACLALALGGALIAGCGDDESDDPTSPAATPAQTTTDSGGEAGGGTDPVTVSMKDSKNIPEQITVKVGQMVVWTNDDSYAHTVTATEGEDFDSGNIDGAGTYEYTADKAGVIDYVCTIHSGQIGKITVSE